MKSLSVAPGDAGAVRMAVRTAVEMNPNLLDAAIRLERLKADEAKSAEEAVAAAGLRDIVIVTGYLEDQIRARVRERHGGLARVARPHRHVGGGAPAGGGLFASNWPKNERKSTESMSRLPEPIRKSTAAPVRTGISSIRPNKFTGSPRRSIPMMRR